MPLNQPEPYWNSKMSYGIFWPLNAEFENHKVRTLPKRLIQLHCYTMDHSCLRLWQPSLLSNLLKMQTIGIKTMSILISKSCFHDGSDQKSLERKSLQVVLIALPVSSQLAQTTLKLKKLTRTIFTTLQQVQVPSVLVWILTVKVINILQKLRMKKNIY